MTIDEARAWRKAFGLPDADDDDVVRDTEADRAYLAAPWWVRARESAPWESRFSERWHREQRRHAVACRATEARIKGDR